MFGISHMIYSSLKMREYSSIIKTLRVVFIINYCIVSVTKSKESDLFTPGQISEDFSKDYIESEITQTFLGNLSVDKSYSVLEQLRQCPLVPLCSFSFNIDVPKDIYSCCRKCNCDASCTQHLDCCPDIIPFEELLGEPLSQLPKEVCVKASLLTFSLKYVYGIDFCPAKAPYKLKLLCSLDTYNIDITFPDIIPVTDLTTGVTYKNRGCAYCNGVRHSNLEYWGATMYCSKTINLPKVNTDKELIWKIINWPNYECNIDYTPGKFAQNHIRKCYRVDVTSCNTTGSWKTYKQKYVDMCALYTAPVHVDYLVYKNVFCALCNEEHPLPLTCPAQYPLANDSGFRAALVINENSFSTTVDCQPGFIRSPITGKCYEVECSIFRRLRNNVCKLFISSVKGLVYEISIRLSPLKSLSINKAIHIVDDLIIWLKNDLVSQNITLDSSDNFAVMVDLIVNSKLNAKGPHELLFYYITFRLRYPSLHNVEELYDIFYKHVLREFAFIDAENGTIWFSSLVRYDRYFSRNFFRVIAGEFAGHHNCILGSEIILNSTKYTPTFETLNQFARTNHLTNNLELAYLKDMSTLKTSSNLCSTDIEAIPIQMLRNCTFTRINIISQSMIETIDGIFAGDYLVFRPFSYIYDDNKVGPKVESIIVCTDDLFRFQEFRQTTYASQTNPTSTQETSTLSHKTSTVSRNGNGQNQGNNVSSDKLLISRMLIYYLCLLMLY